MTGGSRVPREGGQGGSEAYLGVDLESGAPGSQRALYSISIVDREGRFLGKHEKASLARLIRLSWELKPRAIAVDNIYELGRSNSEVVRVLSMLPPDTKVVQVTLVDGRLVDLKEIARSRGLRVDAGKLTPARTSYLLALLASMGVGTVIRHVEEKTIISIHGARSGRAGGWSQQRFQRRLRASVARAVNVVRESLESAGLDYDLHYRRSKGGIETALFTVYAPIEEVRKVVKAFRGQGLTVRLKPSYNSSLLLPDATRGEASRHRYLIVGVDPGITTGIAVLDITGNLIYYGSGRNLDRSRITEIVSSIGRPVIVAVDVADPPDLARRLASQWGAALYTPPQDLTPQEKRLLASKLADSVEDSHVRDALAAAVKAYNAVKAKMSSIERFLEDMGLSEEADKVKAEVIRGVTVAEAVERVIESRLLEEGREPVVSGSEGEVERKERRERRVAVDVSRYVEAMEALRIEKDRLEAEVRALRSRLARMEAEIEKLKSDAAREAMKDRVLASMRASLNSLAGRVKELESAYESVRGEAEKLKEALRRLARGEYVIVRILEKATYNQLRESAKNYGWPRKGEILLIRDSSQFNREAVEAIGESEPLGVIVDSEESPLANSLRRKGVPVIGLREGLITFVGGLEGLALASREVEELLRREKERMKRDQAAGLDLARLVEEYRMQRARSIRR